MALFRKKESPEIPPQFQPLPELAPIDQQMGPPPVDAMRASGMPSRDIVRDLTSQGYPSTDILAGFQTPQQSPANYPQPYPMQSSFPEPGPLPPAPAPPPRFFARQSTDEVQEVAERIVEEKWKSAERELDSIKKWKDDFETNLSNLSDRMTKLEMKLDSIEQAILGKVEEYGKSISDVGTELKAMQKVFATTMPTFTENIKELQGLVDEAKTRRKK